MFTANLVRVFHPETGKKKHSPSGKKDFLYLEHSKSGCTSHSCHFPLLVWQDLTSLWHSWDKWTVIFSVVSETQGENSALCLNNSLISCSRFDKFRLSFHFFASKKCSVFQIVTRNTHKSIIFFLQDGRVCRISFAVQPDRLELSKPDGGDGWEPSFKWNLSQKLFQLWLWAGLLVQTFTTGHAACSD